MEPYLTSFLVQRRYSPFLEFFSPCTAFLSLALVGHICITMSNGIKEKINEVSRLLLSNAIIMLTDLAGPLIHHFQYIICGQLLTRVTVPGGVKWQGILHVRNTVKVDL